MSSEMILATTKTLTIAHNRVLHRFKVSPAICKNNNKTAKTIPQITNSVINSNEKSWFLF